MNWREARDLLDGKGKRRGPRDSLKIARNTYLERGRTFNPQGFPFVAAWRGQTDIYPDNAIGIRFHATYVAIMTPRWTEYNTGGWHTMSTRDRMEYVSGARVGNHGNGWAVFLRATLPCYCTRERHDVSSGIVIEGEHHSDYESPPGMELHFTGRYDPSVPSQNPNGAPVYEWRTCRHCHGTALIVGTDWESGGHPFFDGIRVNADGTRLMTTQPHKPRNWHPLTTVSGWG